MKELVVPMVAIQMAFVAGWIYTHEYGVYDPCYYLIRTVWIVAYTVFSWAEQDQQTLGDWVCQSICMVQYISIVLNVVSYNPLLWRKHG
jgi:hypothetical protein